MRKKKRILQFIGQVKGRTESVCGHGVTGEGQEEQKLCVWVRLMALMTLISRIQIHTCTISSCLAVK